MKPHHEHAILFRAPSEARAIGNADKPKLAVDDGVAAMRRLRYPFMVRPVPSTAGTESARVA
ncbi:hypothetical protein EV385_2993 [Krasilnikovia cinnamomea]|uniref:ATP-grasp domain-containing protein n=1 Tax=Krasilnikovia cinnamomea TaxID=349313 RepID=A0A4Q7ZKV5_9ACTN|nr:hypothetical protein [Krasilnikovia cinnamomea]RZU51191.1 hypothetical protein EV385_2993 [Krasilnikovia cinnamomea]